jgi:hypothetical protein
VVFSTSAACVLETIIARFVEQATQPRGFDNARRAELLRAVEKARVEQQRLIDIVARGAGDVSALVAALRDRQEQLATLTSELDRLKTAVPPSLDRDELIRTARARLVDWQGLLRGNTKEARRILATLLDGRLTFRPQVQGQRRFYEFTGTGTIRPILEGIADVSITRCGVPTGIRTRVLALKGPRPRPLDDGDVRRDRSNAKS